MSPTSRVVHGELENLLAYLIESEIALHVNPVMTELGRVSWRSFGRGGPFLEVRDPPFLTGYRGWLDAGEYSALLFDGSLLQVTYDFAGHILAAHRLAWVPCPFNVDEDLLQTEPVVDVVDMYAAGAPHDVVLRTTIRFDFDAERADENHPAAHLTINASDCRVACAAPLRLGHFVDFVFRNFYPDLWLAHPFLRNVSRKAWGPHTVTDVQARNLHVAWSR